MSGPLPALLAPVTVPASLLYGLAVRARNARFDRGRTVVPVTVPVISVGNVTVGGTGKTPMVTWVTRRLLDAGMRPVIAMRGYGARPGRGDEADEADEADEVMEHRLRLGDVPVVADPDRVAALRSFLPEHAGIDCVVLDDGFQHRRLGRDLDLVLMGAESPERDPPDYIEVDYKDMKARFLRGPKMEDVPYPVQMEPNLVIEFYSR